MNGYRRRDGQTYASTTHRHEGRIKPHSKIVIDARISSAKQSCKNLHAADLTALREANLATTNTVIMMF